MSENKYLFRHYLGIRNLLVQTEEEFYSEDDVPQALFIQDVVRASSKFYNQPCTSPDPITVKHNNVIFKGNLGFVTSYLMYYYRWFSFSDILELLIKVSNVLIPLFAAFRYSSPVPLGLILVIHYIFKNYKYDRYGFAIIALGCLVWRIDSLLFINYLQHLVYILLLKEDECETFIRNKRRYLR